MRAHLHGWLSETVDLGSLILSIRSGPLGPAHQPGAAQNASGLQVIPPVLALRRSGAKFCRNPDWAAFRPYSSCTRLLQFCLARPTPLPLIAPFNLKCILAYYYSLVLKTTRTHTHLHRRLGPASRDAGTSSCRIGKRPVPYFDPSLVGLCRH